MRDELDALGLCADGTTEGVLITGRNDEHDILGTSGDGFLDDDLDGRLRLAVAIDETLEGKGSLVFTGGCDDGFGNFHSVFIHAGRGKIWK